jgi:hypothetical protein
MNETKFRRTRRFSAMYISFVPVLLLLALAFLQVDSYTAVANTTKAAGVKAGAIKRTLQPSRPMFIKPAEVTTNGDDVLCADRCAGSMYCPDAGAIIQMIDGCCARCCWADETNNCSGETCCGGDMLE